jgi:hypothetical protein
MEHNPGDYLECPRCLCFRHREQMQNYSCAEGSGVICNFCIEEIEGD